MTLLTTPPGRESLPAYDAGWIAPDGGSLPFLSYTDQAATNWSDDLEEMHEESSRTHFLDVWTRSAILARLAEVPPDGAIADLGCSSGYLLEDLHRRFPCATLVGVDIVPAGLVTAHALVPSARLVRADVCNLPIGSASLDAVVSANLLEHVRDDLAALREMERVLRPGGRAVIVVPAGPTTYDYYDRFLGHERRYARGELAGKARDATLGVLEDVYLASLLYPAFWLVKQRNRLRYDHLRGKQLEQRVAADIAGTSDSRGGRLLRRLEERMELRLPFGIRELVVLRRVER